MFKKISDPSKALLITVLILMILSCSLFTGEREEPSSEIEAQPTTQPGGQEEPPEATEPPSQIEPQPTTQLGGQGTSPTNIAVPVGDGDTYYIRPDGGSTEQCTGLEDAPYPGSGSAQSCAWDHPFRALPPDGEPRIDGGATLLIGSGSYMMGYGAPGADSCEADYPYECFMPPIPSGPSPNKPTRILGEGWDSGCSAPPELWGTERVDYVLNLIGSSNLAIACLELTDHSDCVEDHSGDLACERDEYPYGPWAAVGLHAEDSSDVLLQHLNIHGFAAGGVHAGRLADWTVEDVRIAGNGWVGWDGDLWEGSDSNSGTLVFRRWVVEWNGCGETWPGGEPVGCWGQSAGGYGDGLGTGYTGGHWIIEDSAFLNNTSDGLDLFYGLEDVNIEIRRTISSGNAGDQIKTKGPATLENVIAVSTCAFFQGKPFTHHVDNCRAGGSALAFSLYPGDQVTMINSTITGQGDCLTIGECVEGENCNGSESIYMRNNIFVGHTDYEQPDENTCLYWYPEDTLPNDPYDIDYSIIIDTKTTPPCPGPNDLCEVSPGLVNPNLDGFDAHLLPDSPAIDVGSSEGAADGDFDGQPRDGNPDIGAYEFRR
jgi:hypothetical protein